MKGIPQMKVGTQTVDGHTITISERYGSPGQDAGLHFGPEYPTFIETTSGKSVRAARAFYVGYELEGEKHVVGAVSLTEEDADVVMEEGISKLFIILNTADAIYMVDPVATEKSPHPTEEGKIIVVFTAKDDPIVHDTMKGRGSSK